MNARTRRHLARRHVQHTRWARYVNRRRWFERWAVPPLEMHGPVSTIDMFFRRMYGPSLAAIVPDASVFMKLVPFAARKVALS